ncbi:MAG: PTS sugar transporter subunit IIA [Hyphomonadaceae bacterium]|nr:PTS sugar transporter subunit IIA [Hyphomonadaceae bacterium]MCA8886191.1 PTS sugar transporter subunit IIA [Hyphomonadaceae bacterium]
MNDLSDLVAANAIMPRLLATSRRQALQLMAETLAKSAGIDARAAFDAVLIRERLSGTGLGEGVATPHGPLLGLTRPVAAFARLDPPQDFEAMDNRPADLVFMLLSPPEKSADHLKAFARISRFLKHADVRAALRGARGADELYALIAGAVHSDAA